MFKKIPRNNRLVYSSPELNIDCSYVVGMTCKTAIDAPELVRAKAAERPAALTLY